MKINICLISVPLLFIYAMKSKCDEISMRYYANALLQLVFIYWLFKVTGRAIRVLILIIDSLNLNKY